MKSKRLILLILAFVLNIAACSLALLWYDWKLILIIILFLWAHNINRLTNETP